MKVGNTVPDKETVSLRIVEEMNISDSSDATINRSDNQRMLSIKSVMDEVGHFFCMWHREQNIYKVCKGGEPYLFRGMVV